MGQANRHDAEVLKWQASLSPDETSVADTALRLLLRFIDPSQATGMCYRLTFFLHLYLLERGIQAAPVVGYINDDTDDVFVSHAWLDYQGKKTDLTLGRTDRPDLNRPGDVLILDFPFRRAGKYTYHLTKSSEAIAVENDWLGDKYRGALRNGNLEIRRSRLSERSGRISSAEFVKWLQTLEFRKPY